jgi:hypothetical protein
MYQRPSNLLHVPLHRCIQLPLVEQGSPILLLHDNKRSRIQFLQKKIKNLNWQQDNSSKALA